MQKTALLSFALAVTAILGVTKVNSQEYIEQATGTIVINNADGTSMHKVYFGFNKFNPVTNLTTHFTPNASESLLLYESLYDASGNQISNQQYNSVNGDPFFDGQKIYLPVNVWNNATGRYDNSEQLVWDAGTEKWEVKDVAGSFRSKNRSEYPTPSAGGGSSSLIKKESDGSIILGDSSVTSSLKIGSGTNPAIVHANGLNVGGENLIRRSADGAVHIGKNSLITIEEGGRQKMWATNAAGESIDIDITNGSRLLINGRDVEKSIDNVGALSAALGSVPAISADSPFTCGFGAGTHSSAYALSAGCASSVSDRVSVNAALATVINNQTGDSDDNLSARAGFTFRLGKIDESPKVAARKAAKLHDKVAKLEESNQTLAASNQSLMKLLQALSARLENLEKIASGQLSLLGDRASSD